MTEPPWVSSATSRAAIGGWFGPLRSDTSTRTSPDEVGPLVTLYTR